MARCIGGVVSLWIVFIRGMSKLTTLGLVLGILSALPFLYLMTSDWGVNYDTAMNFIALSPMVIAVLLIVGYVKDVSN